MKRPEDDLRTIVGAYGIMLAAWIAAIVGLVVGA